MIYGLFFSKEHKVITPIISKNACSSLVLISLKRDDLEKEYAFKGLGDFWSDYKIYNDILKSNKCFE